MPQFGNVPGDDPLGAALQSRAAQSRMIYNQQNPGVETVMPDPAMDGLFQAMSEQGVTGVKGAPGLPTDPNTDVSGSGLPSTYDPNFQSSALSGTPAPFAVQQPALSGLEQAAPGVSSGMTSQPAPVNPAMAPKPRYPANQHVSSNLNNQ